MMPFLKKNRSVERQTKACVRCGRTFEPYSYQRGEELCPNCRKSAKSRLYSSLLAKKIPKNKNGFEIGSVREIGGHEYRIVNYFKKTGIWDVARIQDTQTGKSYVLKTFSLDSRMQESGRQRFEREMAISVEIARATFQKEAESSKINPDDKGAKYVLGALKTGTADSQYYLMMEYCEGGDVQQMMRKFDGKLPFALGTYIILQVLYALDYLHHRPITAYIVGDGLERRMEGAVHRDLKPANILLTKYSDHPEVKLADFGLAKAYEIGGLSGVTLEGTKMGTPEFMCRHQLEDARECGPEVDVWAAAACYYYMLTGCTPRDFPGDCVTFEQKAEIILRQKVISIKERGIACLSEKEAARSVNRGKDYIPVEVARLVDNILDDSKKQRFYIRTAGEFLNQLVAQLPEKIRSYCEDLLFL